MLGASQDSSCLAINVTLYVRIDLFVLLLLFLLLFLAIAGRCAVTIYGIEADVLVLLVALVLFV